MTRNGDEKKIHLPVKKEIALVVGGVILQVVAKDATGTPEAIFNLISVIPPILRLFSAFVASGKGKDQEKWGNFAVAVIYGAVSMLAANNPQVIEVGVQQLLHSLSSIGSHPVNEVVPQVVTPEVVSQAQDLPVRVIDIIKETQALRDAINAPLVAREQAITWANLGSSIISFIEKHPIELIAFVSAIPVVAASRKYWNKFRDTFDVSLEIRRKGDE